ncbi:FecR domain-containing protein [bacterium]|nr:FecR domain-containing protein [bacterium]
MNGPTESADFQPNELERLLIAVEEETASDIDCQRLRDILLTDGAARKRYVQFQMLNAAMTLEGGLNAPARSANEDAVAKNTEGVSGSSRVVPLATRRSSVGIRRWPIVAATVLGCLLAGRWLYLESTSTRKTLTEVQQPKEATSQGIALITRLVDVVWANDNVSDVGDALSPGRIAIESGFAQIEFFCGATVVIEGPADFELISSQLARLRSGRIRAEVPPAARGFSIDVDDMKVVDLGTEFGLSVSTEGARVQVFDGEVEVHQPDQSPKLISSGEAVVRQNDQLVAAAATPKQFLGTADLEARSVNQTSGRYERWKSFSQKLRRDERLIAYYAFEENPSANRRLISSQVPRNRELDGAIVGARQVAGRWSQTGALEFKRPADRVRVQVPGEFKAITLACWVRIDSLDRWYNSLFLTDGYEKGEPHWQILDTGELFFSTRPRNPGEKGGHKEVLSPVFWNPSMSGKWLHLATVFDPSAKRVTHYLNGQTLSEDTIPDHQLIDTIRIGTASIGNWAAPTKPDDVFAIRNLNGRFDEFAIFSAALSSDEVREMYENGKP